MVIVCIIIILALFTSLGHGAGLFACRRTSRVQHETLLHNVLAAGMDFFDQTPTGRSLNRFGGDVEVMDTSLPRFVLNLVRLVLTIFGSIILVSIATPWALLVWCSLAVVYVILQVSEMLKKVASTRACGNIVRHMYPIYRNYYGDTGKVISF